MKELTIKLVLSIVLQIVNAGAIYLAILHMKSAQIGNAAPSETLLVIAGFFILAKTNFLMAKFVKKPIKISKDQAIIA